MIFIDRILRYFSKDIMLPIRCYANKQQMFDPIHRCDCRMFCNKMSGGKPVYLTVARKNTEKDKKYYYRIINGHYCCKQK